MNYTYLHVFYTVAKLQNISKAAEELGVTQPAVSRIISNIEKEYGTKFFYRGKNGVTLTKDGIDFFNSIKLPFAELEKVASGIKDGNKFDKIVVHIGATSTALYCYLFKYLESVKGLFPNVNFSIYSNSSAKLLDMVERGTIDFAFITTPFKGGDELEINNIVKLNDILIAPTSYKNIIPKKISVKSLVEYPFILLSKDMQFREYIDVFLKKHDVRISPVYETDSSAILTPFVESGYGLTFIPDEMAKKSIDEGKCFKVRIIEKLPPRFITFVIKKGNDHSKTIEEIKKTILSGNRI